jgi:hypothetical protein
MEAGKLGSCEARKMGKRRRFGSGEYDHLMRYIRR